MLAPVSTFATALTTAAETLVLPLIGLALIIGGITWALVNHEHGKQKVTAGLVGGAIALMAQPLASALSGSIAHGTTPPATPIPAAMALMFWPF